MPSTPTHAGDEPRPLQLLAPSAGTSAWLAVTLACVCVWMLLRLVFFVGIVGSDDMYYMRFAAFWDRAPASTFEKRLLANGLIGLSMRVFGRNEVAAALPCLAASLSMLGCVLWWCHRHGNIRQAWWAGMIASLLPIEVDAATIISAYPIMVAFMALGTVLLPDAPASRRARWMAAAAFALGVETHFSGVLYAGVVTLTAFALDRRRYAGLLMCTLVLGVCVMALDLLVFHLAFGDAMLRIRLAIGQSPTENPLLSMRVDGRLNAAYFLWPLESLVYSKAFGVCLISAAAVLAWCRRDLPPALRVVALGGAAYWLWVCYGSQVPWAYRPLWRLTRFWQPIVPAVALLLGWALARASSRLVAAVCGASMAVVCVCNLLASGTWDQSAHVSRELLAHAQAHPQQRFLTDYHTHNEMYVLAGLRSVDNVATTTHPEQSQLLDPNAHRAEPEGHEFFDAILENPLNVQRTPAFAEVIRRHAGAVLFETTAEDRMLCRVVPILKSRSWSVRKPPARVRAWEARHPSVALLGVEAGRAP